MTRYQDFASRDILGTHAQIRRMQNKLNCMEQYSFIFTFNPLPTPTKFSSILTVLVDTQPSFFVIPSSIRCHSTG